MENNIIAIETTDTDWIDLTNTEILNKYLSAEEIKNSEFVSISNTDINKNKVIKNVNGPTGWLESINKTKEICKDDFVYIDIDHSKTSFKVQTIDSKTGIVTLSNNIKIHKNNLTIKTK